MCIRDRAGVGQPVMDVVDGRPLFLVRSHLRKGQIRIVAICLLYTSDAADERSSVDLGGRRIIKKKKRVDTGKGGIDSTDTES